MYVTDMIKHEFIFFINFIGNWNQGKNAGFKTKAWPAFHNINLFCYEEN